MTPIQVMIVEDEKIVALHLRQQLTALGYKVSGVASSGNEILRKVSACQPDIVLMDIKIEGDMDGIETASRIYRSHQIPIIYLTAYSEQSIIDRASLTSPYGFLLKPFSERELHATITMAIRRRDVERALRLSEERLALALDAADMGCWEMAVNSGVVARAGHADRILGVKPPPAPWQWEDFLGLVEESDRQLVDRYLNHNVVESGRGKVDFRSKHPDGEIRWLRAQAKSFQDVNDDHSRIVGVIQDITDEYRTQSRLRNAATVFHASRDGIAILDTDFRILDVNHAYTEFVQRPPAVLTGSVPFFADAFRSDVADGMAGGAHWHAETFYPRNDGTNAPARITLARVLDAQGLLEHYIAVVTDLTEVRRAEAELRQLAHFDTLTGLPNRFLALDRLGRAISRARRRGTRMAVLFLDLDNFKQINDSLGHAFGDELLRVVAARMQSIMRGEDTVSRLGGDEFMVVLEQIGDIEDAARVAEKLRAVLEPPIEILGRSLATSATVGISVYPDNGGDGPELIRAADTAMYSVKEAGRGGYAFYTAKMTDDTVLQMTLDHDLRAALSQGDLRLFYQPVFSFTDRRIVCLEALVRWQHPTRGLLGADMVIPVAEHSDLIVDIGDWVLKEACRQIMCWRSRGLDDDVRIAVNVSVRQIRGNRLNRAVETALRDTGLPPDRLEIEVTESMMQRSGDAEVLLALRQLGVHLTIDDFGTGFSCLNSLKNLPIDRLKVDRSFVAGLPEGAKDLALVEAIIAVASRLGMQVTAEGVENAEQWDVLSGLGCADAQGYFMGRPMPAEEIERLIGLREA